jgi:hypothetical protein
MAFGNGRVLVGIALGVGGAMMLPKLLPALADASKPVFKALFKVTVLGIETTREVGAHLREAFEDAVAEMQAELSQRSSAATKPAGEAAVSPPAGSA